MTVQILHGDCREMLTTMATGSVQCCVTSPPYFGLRNYGVDGQMGLEASPDAYIAEMVAVFRGVRRVLRDDGTLWLNLGDSYASGGNGPGMGKQMTNIGANIPPKKAPHGFKSKDLLMIPARVAIALQDDGWYLRSDIIWHKPNPMPESVTDRPTSSHEHVFLLTKNARYFYDSDAVKEPVSVPGWDDGTRVYGGVNKHGANAAQQRTTGRVAGVKGDAKTFDSVENVLNESGMRNIRNVWTIATRPFTGSHFATMPPDLAERCIKAGSKSGDTILDPFGGAGTTGLVADRLGRNAILIELNPAYAEMAHNRIHDDAPLFASVGA